MQAKARCLPVLHRVCMIDLILDVSVLHIYYLQHSGSLANLTATHINTSARQRTA